MLRLLKKLRRNERGNVLLITGFALPVLVGSAGFAVDTVQWTLWKRQLQRAADSAALAGVYARVQGHASQTANQAVTADLARNHHTGIPLQPNHPVVTFPTSSNWLNGVRVELAVSRKLSFSSVFMANAPIIRARATAATIATGVYCVVSLEPTSATGITATGNGALDLGCGMITNSTSITAAIATGSSEVNATPIAAVGNVPLSDNWNGAELLPFTVKQEDPFADLTVPAQSACAADPVPLTINSNAVVNRSQDTGVHCFTDMDIRGDITFGPATYVINAGNFNVGAQAHIICNGCTIVLTNFSTGSSPTIGQVTINGGAEIDMSAPKTGHFAGVLFYQDRRAVTGTNARHIINGNANSLLSGAFYFPSQRLEVNGTSGLTVKCAQFVARNVEFSGNGSITNTCDSWDDEGRKAIMGKHVRLVA